MDWTGLLDGMTGIVRDTFGEPFTYTPVQTGIEITSSVITGEPLRGVFDPAHEPLDAGGSIGAAGRITVLDIRLADIGLLPMKKDAVSVSGRDWEVIEKYPSSSGMMKLSLRKL